MFSGKKKNMATRIFAVLLALVITISFTPVDSSIAAGTVKSVKVTNLPAKTLTVAKGKSFTFKVKVDGSKGISQKVTYKSSKPSVVAVTSKGKVTGKKSGSAVITIASAVNKKKSVKITVKVGKPVTKVTIKATKKSVSVGKTITLKASVAPTKPTNKNIVWSSSNTKIATVSSKGVVKGIKAGTAKITATAQDGSGKKSTVTITVMPKATGVTVAPKTSTIVVNGTVKLKSTVKPSKAAKDVTWKSSNSSVAKVASDGTVTGLKAGTATITATTKDGSKKSASSVITVKAVEITAMSVLTPDTVLVTLSDPVALTAANFSVKVKQYNVGDFSKAKIAVVDNISTKDNKNYTIVLKNDSYINELENVQVSISSIPGNPNASKVGTYNAGTFSYVKNEYIRITTNNLVDDDIYLSDNLGYASVTVTGIPAGISYKVNPAGNKVDFYGKTTAKGTVYSKIIAADEVGNVSTYTLTWIIDSPDVISAPSYTVYETIGSSGKTTVGTYVMKSGGSGSYSYSLVGTTYGLEVNDNGYLSGTLLAAGKYPIQVKVTDKNNAAISATATITFDVVNTVSIVGMVTDLSGKPIPYATVYFTNKNKACLYGTGTSTNADSNGAYSVAIPAGTYDIKATSYQSSRYLYSQSLTTSRSGFDIALAVRRVAIYSNNANVKASSLGDWRDAYGESYGYGDTVYLKDGTYSLKAESKTNRMEVTAVLNVTVSAATQFATASVTYVDLTKGNLTVGLPTTASLTSDYIYYRFTPTESGYYYFYGNNFAHSTGNNNSQDEVYMRLENSDGEYMASKYLYPSKNNYIYTYMVSGQSYYIGVKSDNYSTTTMNINISKTYPFEQ